MNYVVVDFETASLCDLKASGADRYSEDFSTEVLCLGWEVNGRPSTKDLWHPGQGNDMPPVLRRALADGWMFVAHNARFERAIWRNIMVAQYGWPDVPLKQWHDTLAVCAMLTLPQKLEQANAMLKLPALKDTDGSRVTKALSRPDKHGNLPARTPQVLNRVFQYNLRDIDAQTDLHKRIGWLPDGEREVWELDQEINDRGVKLDMAFVAAAQQIVDEASAPLAAEFQRITGFKMTQIAKVGGWLVGEGVYLPNMQKETLDRVLGETAEGEDLDDDQNDLTDVLLPPHVRRALHIRQLIGSASIKKLGAMSSCACEDGRARGLLQYHAAGTGRWGGRIIQPQNFPRGTIDKAGLGLDQQQIIDAIMTGDPDYVEMLVGPAVETVVSSLRYAITAERGHELVAGDYAGIEARVVLALAGQYDKVALLASGVDVYCDMATQIFGFPVNKKDHPEERQTGKNSVLGLGFGMGHAKFRARYCADQTEEFAKRVVETYRKEWAPEVPKLWRALEYAAVQTVWTGVPHEAYGIEYRREDAWLTARLPNGKKLWYYDVKTIRQAMPWDPTDIRPGFTYRAKKQGKLVTVNAYGALLTENAVQAMARELLVEAMKKCRVNGLPLVLTVHDENVTEPLIRPDNEKVLEQVMAERSDWAAHLRIPLAIETWSGDRYRK